MKHLNTFLVATLLLLGVGVANAQDANNPWAIEVGVNAVDTFPVGLRDGQADSDALNGDLFEEFYNVNDHWNMVPSVSKISIGRYIGSGFTFAAVGTVNRIEKLGDVSVDDLSYVAADGEIKYNFGPMIGVDWLAPSLGVGGGYTWVDDIGFGTANGLVAVAFWLGENFGLNLQSTYKHSFEDDYGVKHFQHSAGVIFKFGGKDTDGDGIYDYEDECPETPGLKEFNGCPDTDGDGIEDRNDACPTEAGLAAFNGCPDTDGDGIPDPQDACPTVPGIAAFNGCPDTDGDGIADPQDECPTVAGPKANNGCPWPDRDGDGVADKDDLCPDIYGTVANDGCPELSLEVRKALNDYAKTIQFDTGKTTLKPASLTVLENVKSILNEYIYARFHVDGHTDSVGRDSTNQTLSEGRAAAVVTWLTSNGIAADRLVSRGFGETQPLLSNDTKDGRAANRRVEINLIPRN